MIEPQDAASSNPLGFRNWLISQVAVTTARIDRAQRNERKLRECAALQAQVCWDADRRIEAEILGAKLEKDPTEVVAGLRQTPQGCEWLLKRWALLIHTAETDHEWTIEQALLASRMLGIPPEFENEANPLEAMQLDGRSLQSWADLAALARREVTQLLHQRDVVAPIDEAEKLLAQKGELTDEARQENLRQLGRHERTLYVHLRWLVRQIEERTEEKCPTIPQSRTLEVAVEASEAKAEPKASVNENPETLSSVKKRPDLPASPDRCQSRRKKAELRREARARKLDRRRA